MRSRGASISSAVALSSCRDALTRLPTIFLFTCAFMIVEKESWPMSIAVSAGLVVFYGFVFDELLALPWLDSLLGDLSPALKETIPGI